MSVNPISIFPPEQTNTGEPSHQFEFGWAPSPAPGNTHSDGAKIVPTRRDYSVRTTAATITAAIPASRGQATRLARVKGLVSVNWEHIRVTAASVRARSAKQGERNENGPNGAGRAEHWGGPKRASFGRVKS